MINQVSCNGFSRTDAIDSKTNVLQQVEGKCLLAASQTAQEEYALKEGENSIFTYYLLESLKGNEKSADVDDNITAYSLGNYVYSAILNLPARKRPKQRHYLHNLKATTNNTYVSCWYNIIYST